MSRKRLIEATALGLALTVAAAGFAVAGPTKRVATLSGGRDGDPNGTGRAVFQISPSDNKICFRITYERVFEPGYGGIVSGYPYNQKSEVELWNGDRGGRSSPIEGCARDIDRSALKRIKEHPRRFTFVMFRYGVEGSGMRGELRRPS